VFRSILVPLDGSAFAEQALPWALALARRAHAGLELVRGHVLYALKEPACAWLPYEPALEAACKQEEQLYLDATARWLAAVSPVPTTSALVSGVDAEGILGRIQVSRPGLVVMTTHGRGPVGRLLLGSVADEVVRRAGPPVLLVRPRDPAPGLLPEPAVGKVLVALDGSALAEQALGPALELARLLEARCALLRVVEPNHAPTRPTGRPVATPEAEARAYLERLAGRPREEGAAVEVQVAAARNAAEAILEQARAQGCDLIALATHGRGGLGRLLLGSVADKVVRAASVPVLVYHPSAR
jgi:nucleotide-binding universal stress UspA family protein